MNKACHGLHPIVTRLCWRLLSNQILKQISHISQKDQHSPFGLSLENYLQWLQQLCVIVCRRRNDILQIPGCETHELHGSGMQDESPMINIESPTAVL